MTSPEKDELRAQIRADITSFKGDIETLGRQIDPIAPDVAIGRLSRMDAIGEKSVKEVLLRSTIEKVARLRETLEKIDLPDFGKCSVCGDDIAPARIIAVPESGKCIRCA